MIKPITSLRVSAFATSAYRFLTARRNPATLLLGTIVIIAMFVFVMLGSGFIGGAGPYWQHPNYDAGAHISGWLFYKEDTWHLPLFDTIRMNYPDGASIIFTDSIPAVALIAKLVATFVTGNWHYFGLFVAGAYVLNGVALLWLLRQLGVSNLLGAAFAFVVACFTSLYNIQFESFFAHFFVIFSLGYYIKLVRRYDHKSMALFTALVLLASLVHPYLFFMSLAVYLATLLTVWRRKGLPFKTVALWLGAFFAIAGVIVLLSGHFAYTATGYQEKLYGKGPSFALDLAAPFTKKYTSDEIGTYFGLGVWVLLAVGLGVWWRYKIALVKQHIILVTLCAVFLLLAVSNTLFLNGNSLLHVPLPPALTGVLETFRASKRFIVPLYYAIAVCGFVLALRQKSKVFAGVVVVALLLQIVDMNFFVQGMGTTARQGQRTVLDETQWKQEFAGTEKTYTFPSYSCLFDYRKAPLSRQWEASLELYQIAAMEHKISNSIRVAKRTKDCPAEATTAHTPPGPTSIFIYFKDDAGRLILEPSPECLATQKTFTYGIYCKGSS